tara:strand:- start:661 stop:1161 length:501 start_codon:yes stop_codon:yes gene_type:complete
MRKLFRKINSILVSKVDSKSKNQEYNIKEIGNIIKTRREDLNISKESLSNNTKISLSIINSLERGEIFKLPDQIILRAILKRIEKELQLNTGDISYSTILFNIKDNRRKQYLYINKDLNIFSTYSGNLIYFTAMIITIALLNYTFSNKEVIKYKYLKDYNSEYIKD